MSGDIPESPVPILIFNVQAGNFEGILCSYKGLEKDSKLPLGNTIRGSEHHENSIQTKKAFSNDSGDRAGFIKYHAFWK
ncbi:hypothetical protein PMJ10TS2_65040 [Paenibacillus melissococcoides]